jgi:hypothetical protein
MIVGFLACPNDKAVASIIKKENDILFIVERVNSLKTLA